MTPKKKLIILLALVLALYATVTWLGISRGDDPQAKPSTDWVVTIRDLLIRQEPHVKPDQLIGVAPSDAACLSGDTLTLRTSQECVFKVPGSASPVRALQLRLIVGTEVEIHWRADGSPPVKMDVPLDNRKPAKLTVTRAGGTLTVRAGAAPPLQRLKVE